MGGWAGADRWMAGALCVVGLVMSATAVAMATSGIGRIVALAALMLAMLAGESMRDWREALAVGLAVSAVVAWCTSDTSQVLAPALATLCIVATAIIAAWHRAGIAPSTSLHAVSVQPTPMLALPAPRPRLQPQDSPWHYSSEVGVSLLLRDAAVTLAQVQAGRDAVADDGRHARVA